MAITLQYSGGTQAYDVSKANRTTINVTFSPNAEGSFSTFADQGTSPIALIILASPSNAVTIDTGHVDYHSISITHLGNKSSVILNQSRNGYTISGESANNRPTAFLNNSLVGGVTRLSNTTLVMNGNNTPSSFSVVDGGGNTIWAGHTTLNFLSSAVTNHALSTIIAGKSTGIINIDDFAPSLVPRPGADINVVLNALDGKNNGLFYQVNQNASAHTNIFQESGNISFSGQNTTLVLNHGNTDSTLQLTGNTELWNGDGTSFVTTALTNNAIINSGKGNVFINNTQQTSADPEAVSTKGNIDISAVAESTGKITYYQGNEDAILHGNISNLSAQLGAGTTTIDLQNIHNLENFSVVLGTGNLILQNFATLDTTTQQKIENGLHINQQRTISSIHDSTNNDTVIALDSGTTLTFKNYDITPSLDSIFSS